MNLKDSTSEAAIVVVKVASNATLEVSINEVILM